MTIRNPDHIALPGDMVEWQEDLGAWRGVVLAIDDSGTATVWCGQCPLPPLSSLLDAKRFRPTSSLGQVPSALLQVIRRGAVPEERLAQLHDAARALDALAGIGLAIEGALDEQLPPR